jgi:hypothetical protein
MREMWNRSKSHYLWCESLFHCTILLLVFKWVCRVFFTPCSGPWFILTQFRWQLKIFFTHPLRIIFIFIRIASSRRCRTSNYGRSGGSWSCDKIDEWPNVLRSEINSGDVGWQNEIQVSNKLITGPGQQWFIIFHVKNRIDESDTARTERLGKWDEFLDKGEEEASGGQSTTTTSNDAAQSETS